MKNPYFQRLFPVIITLGFISCNEQAEPVPTPPPYPDLSIFMDRFEAEAKARGLEIDLSGVEFAYADEIKFSNGTNSCGYGWSSHPETGKRTILISKSPNCGWATLSDVKREQFFFHEIGHAFLNLEHDNSLLCDGKPTTLMNGNILTLNFFDGPSESKTYYVDELFDRLVANTKCIDFGQDWDINPVFRKHKTGEEGWNFYNSKGTMTGTRLPDNDLAISSVPGKTSTETGYWFRQLNSPNIPQGAKVTLRTKVSSAGLNGPGAAIGLRVYDTQLENTGAITRESLVLSTEATPVNGVLNKKNLEVSFSNFSRKTIHLIPFAVMMPGTEGEANFEDFEIIVEMP
jgi:hypothetical protein